MTVSTTLNKITIPGDGANKTFTFTFAMPNTGQGAAIQVYYTDASGNISLISSTLYTLSVNAAVSPNPTPVGGTVTYPLSGSAIALGTSLTILRTLPETQPISLANQGALYQPVVEASEDALVMLIQQLQELLGRQITVAVSDPTPIALPPVAQRAGLGMGFDSSGNPTAISSAPAGTISSAMAPFVGSATLAAAKALLGYGSMANENIGAAGSGLADDGGGNARIVMTVSAVSGNQSITGTSCYTCFLTSGTLTFALAKLTTLFNGFEIVVYCLTGSVQFNPNAADTIQGSSSGTGVSITAGQVARLKGDGTATWLLSVSKFFGVGSARSTQVFTSGTAQTYSTPKGCTALKIREVAGGGGGSGTTTSGGDGGATSFNAITTNPGRGGDSAGNGAGGTAGAGTASFRISGQPGTIGGTSSGGSSVFSGAGILGALAAQSNAVANTGSGGCGGNATHQGGGAGEYAEFVINNPAATYTYTVGAAGAAGTGATSGGAGAAGLIIVEEIYGG